MALDAEVVRDGIVLGLDIVDIGDEVDDTVGQRVALDAEVLAHLVCLLEVEER